MNHYFSEKIRQFAKITLLVVSVFLVSCQSRDTTQTNNQTSRKMRFKNFQELKLGFTTQNFLLVMPVSVENSRQLIDYAEQEGYAWLELRDPDATLTLEESKEIADYARGKGIEISYAIQKGLLDTDFWPVFNKGVKNAAVFKGPGIFRSLASGAEISGNATRKGWTQAELDKVVQYADSAAGIAHENGLQYVIENGGEAFFGDGAQYYGIADVFSRLGDQVGWQFDTANPFSVARVHASPDSIKTFLQQNAGNLFYIHLKAAQNGQAQAVLMDNPLPFQEVFQEMTAHNVPYVAIELQAVDNKEQAFEHMRKSIDYLKSQDIITIP